MNRRETDYEAFERSSVARFAAEGTSLRRDFNAAGISAAVSNRTHRVVRERAKILRARRSKARSLWLPLTVCAALMVGACFAIWTVLVEWESVPSGIPDASQQLLVFTMWSLPLSAALLALVWFRRSPANTQGEDEGESAR